jgi:Glycoside hydrolase family 44
MGPVGRAYPDRKRSGHRHAINPDIYGIVNYGLDPNFAKEIKLPNTRWGGDGTTRYNWQVDSSDAGFDWYFMGGSGNSNPTPGAGPDTMIRTFQPAGTHQLLTIPIIPYINSTAAWTCSFPVSVYGPQQSTNPYVHPNGDNCGNSIAGPNNPNGLSGTQLIDKNIYANHINNSPQFQQNWLDHLLLTFGTAATGGVPYYQLDNEPGGWGNTHRDVLPNGADYDTIFNLGSEYAAMIKATDPTAKVIGPSDFTLGGWIGTSADMQEHGGLYAGQWYVQQMQKYGRVTANASSIASMSTITAAAPPTTPTSSSRRARSGIPPITPAPGSSSIISATCS